MKYLISFTLIVLIFSSCSKEEEEVASGNEYSATTIHNIPYGGEGTLGSGDYTGQGNAVNTAGTKVTIQGTVTVDAISASGSVYVPSGATLVVKSVMTVGGGGTLDIEGTLITETYTQVGNTYMTNGKLSASGKFTIGGGTTLYMENSEVEANELVIVGHVQAIENTITQAANWYSMIELTGSKYLNRGGGTKVCGSVLFNANTDQGASGISMEDVTSTAVGNNSAIRIVYGLSQSETLYQYNDNCAAVSVMPAH
jgi:hypothetical protein